MPLPDPYPESRLLGFSRWDGVVWFYSRVSSLVTSHSLVLDVGCGRGSQVNDPVVYRRDIQIMRGRCERVIGIDVDEAAKSNTKIDEFRLIEDDQWPIESGTVDVAVSDWVIEHIARPEQFFSECARVVKPGGYLCLRTSNKYGYPAVASRLIPERLHNRVLRFAQKRTADDIYPAHYRCNTRHSILAAMRTSGFDPWAMGYESEPTYLSFSHAAYSIAARATRLLPQDLRSTLVAFGVRL